MPDDIICICVGRGYFEDLPGFQPGETFIGRLSTAAGIETGPVECQTFWLDRADNSIGIKAIAILEVKAFGGWHILNFTAYPATRVAGVN